MSDLACKSKYPIITEPGHEKTCFCVNKAAHQLHAKQGLCFCYIDDTIPQSF